LEQNPARQDERTLDAETLPYIYSMLDVSQAEAVSILRPYSGRSEQWDQIGWKKIRQDRTSVLWMLKHYLISTQCLTCRRRRLFPYSARTAGVASSGIRSDGRKSGKTGRAYSGC